MEKSAEAVDDNKADVAEVAFDSISALGRKEVRVADGGVSGETDASSGGFGFGPSVFSVAPSGPASFDRLVSIRVTDASDMSG